MSSEMRESKFTNEDLETISRTWNSNKYTEHTAMLLASELLWARALLARTEAGADGDKGPWRWKRTGSKVDVYSDDFTHDVALRIDGDFASEADADVYAAWLAGRLNTHPQDASGDAEDARRYRWARDHVGGTAWNDDNFATVTIGVTVPKPRGTCAFDVTAEMLDAAIDAAIQAKEAK